MRPIRIGSRCGSRRSRAMKIEGKQRLEVHKADLSGSVYEDVNLSGGDFHNINLSGSSFDDVNMSGWRVHNVNLAGLRIDQANLAGASIVNGRLEGMTIEGLPVTDLLAFWREGHKAAGE